ncbi:hypothetical protein OCU04_009342 [Sclerotinia nivalis]|uniref:Uncharacterized protein n=1 Tax=Sclerotinia nivalis TaxID=352851 RepID=A0A9X0AIF7_9HELO|nr:hypothetical protein OCU04_009342 [Sclerotinia nivalis]
MDPEFYYPEEAEKCWAGDPYMLEETKHYGHQAREFGESFDRKSMQHHPWADNDNLRWLPRLRLFDVEDNSLRSREQPQHFESAYDLYSYLTESRASRSNSKTQKQLIILEDIDPRFAEGDFTSFAGNCARSWVINNTWNILNYYSPVSYWGQDHGEGSWTAIIVVDPLQSYLLPKDGLSIDPSEEAIYLQIEESKALCISKSIVMAPPNSYTIKPQKESMFDFLVEAHKRSSHQCSLDPFSATAYARNFVRAVWEDDIADRIEASHNLVFDNQEIDDSFEAIQSRDRRIIQGYQRLISERYDMRLDRKNITEIAWAFQSGWDSSLPVNSSKFQTRQSDTTRQIEYDGDIWKFLDKKLEMAEIIEINQHMEEYAQRAALNEAYATNLQTATANRQARSARQLTKIATMAVPSTVVASVFSMGGDFAAGEKLFPIYWAISLLITFALLIWELHEEIMKAWLSLGRIRFAKKHPYKSNFEISDCKSTGTRPGKIWRKLLRRRKRGGLPDVEMATRSN